MNASKTNERLKTLTDALGTMRAVATLGELRQIVANSMLALVRKEISTTDAEALTKGLDSISKSINAEIKIAKTKIELRPDSSPLNGSLSSPKPAPAASSAVRSPAIGQEKGV